MCHQNCHTLTQVHTLYRDVTDNEYEIQHPTSKATQVVTVRRLKPFHDTFRLAESHQPKKVSFSPDVVVHSPQRKKDEVTPLQQGDSSNHHETAEDTSVDLPIVDTRISRVLPSGMTLRPRR